MSSKPQTAKDISFKSPQSTPKTQVHGLIQFHNDMLEWMYESHGALIDTNLTKMESSGVKREHVVYGVVGLLALYLLGGQHACFLSNLIGVIYPAYCTSQALKNGSNQTTLLTYWFLFAQIVLLDGVVAGFPGIYLLRTLVLVFSFLPHTNGSTLIYTKAFQPLEKCLNGFLDRKRS